MYRIRRLTNKKNYFHLLSFSIPVTIFLLIFIVSGFYPFGDNQILVIDAYHQYYQFMVELRGKILEGQSIFYTWHLGLGSDFLSLMAYYCTSPLYLLSVFIPESLLSIFFAVLIAVKVGIAGLTFSLYLKSIYGKKDYSLVIFSLFYALSGFIAGYYWNIMWLDVFALFPLVILGLKNIVNNNKFLLYILALALCFFTNYYMSIFVSIFVILFYILYSINIKVKLLDFIKRGFKILAASILSAGLFAWILIPTAITLTNVFKTASPFTGEVEIYNSFIDIFSNLLAFNFPTVREGLPNIYSGLITIFLVLPYFLSKNIKVREKVLSVFILVLLILSTNINLLNYIWHGFRYTNMLPYRFSFIFSFVMGIIAYKGYKNIGDFNRREYIYLSFIALGIVLFLGSKRTIEVLVSNTILLILYMVLLFRNKIKYRRINTIILFMLIIAEFFANEYIGISTGGKTSYSIFNKNREEIEYFIDKVEEEEENDFYRLEVLDRFTYNDPSLYQYNGVALFSSTIDSRVSIFLENIGIPSYPIGNRYFYNYGTPLTNGILNLDYLISRDKELYDNYSIELVEEKNDIYLYKNNKSLPLGFMIEKNALEENLYGGAIDNQNSIFKSFTGVENDIFTIIEKSNTHSSGLNLDEYSNGRYSYELVNSEEEGEINIEYTIEQSGYYYLDSDKLENESVTISNINWTRQLDTRRKNVVAVGYLEEGETITITAKITDEDDGDYMAKLYFFQEEIFEKGYDILKSQSADVIEYNSRKVKMDIDILKDGYLFTSIPYNEGWELYLDGEKIEIKSFKDAFVGAEIPKGKHILEFKYTPVGFNKGAIIGLASLMVLLLVIKNERRKNTEEEYLLK